jgi:undecaprenyl-diphosphatase
MGLVQGITELFPVSSLGHGVLLPALLGWHNLVNSQSTSQSFFLVFLVGLHVGTAIGLIVYYRKTWLALLRGLIVQLSGVRENGVSSLWQLRDPAIGIAGVLLEHQLRVLFDKPLAAAIFLTINGVILLAGERLLRSRGRHAKYQQLDSISPLSALAIGSSQILALFAGISRSGVTMVSGLMGGLDHDESANFAFLLATPVILLAGLFKLPQLMGSLGDGVRLQTLVGALCAMVAAYVAVRFLTKWFTTKTLVPFGIYCLVAGLLCVVRFA